MASGSVTCVRTGSGLPCIEGPAREWLALLGLAVVHIRTSTYVRVQAGTFWFVRGCLSCTHKGTVSGVPSLGLDAYVRTCVLASYRCVVLSGDRRPCVRMKSIAKVKLMASPPQLPRAAPRTYNTNARPLFFAHVLPCRLFSSPVTAPPSSLPLSSQLAPSQHPHCHPS